MNKKIIDDLLQYGERVTLECKKAETALPKSVWETYSALDLLIADNKGRWTKYKLNSEYNQSGLSNGLSESESTTISVLTLIQENPYITRKELSSILGISITAIQKHINKLKFNNQIKREGPVTRGGHGIIISE